MLGGRETLEVVGESHYQDALWRCVGGDGGERVRCQVQAVLVHEPENPHDGNAIAVLIEGQVVGYLSREDAAVYLPGLRVLTERHECSIGLEGHIVGGGQRADGRGMLGVFLDHDPADFGLRAQQVAYIGELRTGLSEAIATDLEDDRYDLSWFDRLSGSYGPQDMVPLRRLLANERDPIDRHFMLAELAKCLYKSRDVFASALDEFDVARGQGADQDPERDRDPVPSKRQRTDLDGRVDPDRYHRQGADRAGRREPRSGVTVAVVGAAPSHPPHHQSHAHGTCEYCNDDECIHVFAPSVGVHRPTRPHSS